MINIKEHEIVKTGQELQNLVTSVILRVQDTSTVEKAMDFLNKRLRGSKYHNSKEAEEMLWNTLNIFDERKILTLFEDKNGNLAFKHTITYIFPNKKIS